MVPPPREAALRLAPEGLPAPGHAQRTPHRQPAVPATAEVAQASDAHQRYPASMVAWVQFRLTPLAVSRHATDLEVSLVEPWHSLMISSRQAPATVTRAVIRFWIASNGARKFARHCGDIASWLRD